MTNDGGRVDEPTSYVLQPPNAARAEVPPQGAPSQGAPPQTAPVGGAVGGPAGGPVGDPAVGRLL
ncbi:serine/threonine protein kinase, partial [Streptomyces sp. SID4917]|nr:serine/threonine protein kinase [Streptomyces sp. SID4917]